MKSIFIALIPARFRKEKTVGDIVSKLQKTSDELADRIADLSDRGFDIEDQIGALREEQRRVDAEADRAARISERLEALIQ